VAQTVIAVWVALTFTHFVTGTPRDFGLVRDLTVVALVGAAVYGTGAQFLHPSAGRSAVVAGPLAAISASMIPMWLFSFRHGVPFAISPSLLLFAVICGIALGFVIWLSSRLAVTPNDIGGGREGR
jgi:hypothetical protein